MTLRHVHWESRTGPRCRNWLRIAAQRRLKMECCYSEGLYVGRDPGRGSYPGRALQDPLPSTSPSARRLNSFLSFVPSASTTRSIDQTRIYIFFLLSGGRLWLRKTDDLIAENKAWKMSSRRWSCSWIICKGRETFPMTSSGRRGRIHASF